MNNLGSPEGNQCCGVCSIPSNTNICAVVSMNDSRPWTNDSWGVGIDLAGRHNCSAHLAQHWRAVVAIVAGKQLQQK